MERGALPIEEALGLTSQIADALETAHVNGVIHRDLKPANIKVTPDGKVKVLDFGLAKAFTDETSSADLSNSPTLSAAGTRAGVILGTAAYMSPEQARGKPVDKRTDLFAFGALLYDMLTARKVFQGDEVSDVLASVLKTEPDWDALPANIHPRIREILRRCLEKDPKKRRRDIGDVRVEIEDVLTHPGVETPNATSRHRVAPFALAVGLSIVVGIAAWSIKPSPPKPVHRFVMVLPEGDRFSSTGRHLVALSPSGAHLAYVANGQLYLRAMDEMEAVPIRGTETGRGPFFSPDGQWIGFWAEEDGGRLKKVPVTGGAPVTLCEASSPSGASWARCSSAW